MSLSKFIFDYNLESNLYRQTSYQLSHELEDQIDEVFHGPEVGDMIYTIEGFILNSMLHDLKNE